MALNALIYMLRVVLKSIRIVAEANHAVTEAIEKISIGVSEMILLLT